MPRLLALAILCSTLASAAPVRILVAYYSETGNNGKMAASEREGAATVPGAVVTLRKVADVIDDELRASVRILLGTPVQLRNLAVGAKQFLDRVAAVLGKAGKTFGEGRPAGVF